MSQGAQNFYMRTMGSTFYIGINRYESNQSDKKQGLRIARHQATPPNPPS